MNTESVYKDELKLPTTSLDIHVVKGVEGNCSFTESSLSDEFATLVAPANSGFIFISREFIESTTDPVDMERFRDVPSDDEKEEEESVEVVSDSKTTLSKFVDTEDEEFEKKPERIHCEFCSYITTTYLACTIYKTQTMSTRKEEKVNLTGVDTPNRIEANGLFICNHCVDSLREQSREFVDGLEVILATNNI